KRKTASIFLLVEKRPRCSCLFTMDTSWVLLPNISPNQVSKEIVGRGISDDSRRITLYTAGGRNPGELDQRSLTTL
ncbi:MAG TPA: hypothetical protein VNL14_22800, partial [Candidatus Acidoferrales bacterium]|nr:hypothetical protein [Candidatus Acidoferrales bacterium]